MLAQRALLVAFAVALLGSLAWGGATQPTPLRALMGLAAVTLLAASLARPRIGSPSLSPLLIALACFCGATLLWAMPIPSSLHATLQPLDDAVRSRTLGERIAFRPISDDLGATLLCAGRLAMLLAFGLAATSLARHRRRWLPALLLATLAATIGLCTLSLFGSVLPPPLFAPEHTRALVRSPFQNPNHLGALVACLLPLAWAHALRARASGKLALGLLVAASNAVLWSTHSRGALVGGALGQVAILVWQGGVGARRVAAIVGLGGVAALVAELVGRGASVPSMSRLVAWRDALSLLRDHLVLGVGPGAFGLVFPRYSSVAGRVQHVFVENQYAQVVLDLGVPMGLLLLALTAFLVLVTARRVSFDHGTARAAVVGLAVLALHDVADFASWSGTVALVGVSLVALLPADDRLAVRGAWVVPIIALPLLCVCASMHWRTPIEDERRLEAALSRSGIERTEIIAATERALHAHPDDAELALLASTRLLELGAPESARFVELALLLAPGDVRAHTNAAWALGRAGYAEQAAAELSAAALAAGDRDVGAVIDAALLLLADRPLLLARVLPPRPPLIANVMTRLGASGHALAARQLLEAIEERGDDVDDALVVIRARLEVGSTLDERDTLRPWVDRLETHAATPADRRLVATVWTNLGEDARADAALRAILGSCAEADCVLATRELASLLVARGQLDAARTVLDEALSRATERTSKAELLRQLAALDARAGRTARAEQERAEAEGLSR